MPMMQGMPLNLQNDPKRLEYNIDIHQLSIVAQLTKDIASKTKHKFIPMDAQDLQLEMFQSQFVKHHQLGILQYVPMSAQDLQWEL